MSVIDLQLILSHDYHLKSVESPLASSVAELSSTHNFEYEDVTESFEAA